MKLVQLFMLTVALIGSYTYADNLCQQARCGSNYLFNPYSATCFRIVELERSWNDAKAYCEEKKEYLAVLNTLDSVFWFKHVRQTHPKWNHLKRTKLWIAGKRFATSDTFKWYGRYTGEITTGDWEQVQADGTGTCVQVFGQNRATTSNIGENYKWDDVSCSTRNFFVCETGFSAPNGP